MYSGSLVMDPMMAGAFRCKECHMNFQSQQLLSKHKLKFCVGSTSDPDDLQMRRGFRSTSPRVIVSPDDRDDYRRNPNQDQQLRSLAENHGRQMEYLNLKNRDLERQREDIRRQLENLGRRTVVPPQDNTADLLRELREQEIRNQRALDDLKRQLHDLHGNQKVNVIEIEKPVYPQQPPPPPPPPPEPPKKSLVFPVYYGKSLVAEICAIRQAYLQNGGNDPDYLAQMSQMQAEAQAIEDEMNKKKENRSPREKPKDNDATVRLLEMENERLNQEFRLLQEQNLLAQNRKKSDKEGKDVHLHISVPKSMLGAKSNKKRKIVRKDSLPPQATNDQQVTGFVPATQPLQFYSYVPQQQYLTAYSLPLEQPSMTVYSLPQGQPAVSMQTLPQGQPAVSVQSLPQGQPFMPLYSFPQEQRTIPVPSVQQQQPVQQLAPSISARKSHMMTSYNVPKRATDARSYYSEPNRKSHDRVVNYTATHEPDGSVCILRSNSFGHMGLSQKPYVPPLDLRDLATPADRTKNRNVSGKPWQYKSQPFSRKLSRVSERALTGSHPPTGGAYDKLPAIPVLRSRSESPEKPGSRSGQVEEPQIYNYDTQKSTTEDNRPSSNQTFVSEVADEADDDLDNPGRTADSPVQDIAWQVRRSSPPQQTAY